MKETKVTIPYCPRETAQLDLRNIHDSAARFRVVVAHRRLGKTTLANNELIRAACTKKGNYFYVAPTYRQAKLISWDIFKYYAIPQIVSKVNESELYIEFVNGSKILLKGADSPDSLRGVSLAGLVIDEAAYCREEIWATILQPALIDTGGGGMFIFTLNGDNWFWDLFVEAEKKENWARWLLRASETKVIVDDELERLKGEMSEAMYAQELECEPRENAGAVFRRVKENSVLTPKEPEEGREYVIGVDLAKYQDWTVLSIFDIKTNEQVYLDRFQRIDWSLQQEKIKAAAFKYNNASVLMDATGVGDPILEGLQGHGVNTEGLHLTANSKKDIINKLVIMLSQDRVQLLADEVQTSELEQYQYEMTRAGNLRMSAPEGKHDDIVIADALAVWDLNEKPVPYFPKTQNFKPRSLISRFSSF